MTTPVASPPATCLDNDGDGVPGTGDCSGAPLVDCNDNDPAVYPGGAELCDGRDNNCNGQVDEGLKFTDFYADQDHDGFGAGAPERSCLAALPGKVSQAGDCNDANADVFPGAPEACNQRDDNCNNQVDENVQNRNFYADNDGDGFGAGPATVSCQLSLPGKVRQAGDCDDSLAAVNPNAVEVCNGRDDNCNGSVDETFANKGLACAAGAPGVCAAGSFACVSGQQVCVSTQQPSAELCDGLDNNCDGQPDEGFNPGAACTVGVGVCARSGVTGCRADQHGTACSAVAGTPTASACDGQDNDCDGQIDEPELVSHSVLASGFDPTAAELTPFYYTSSSCNGGQANGGTDAWSAVIAAYVENGDLFLQQLREDGVPTSQTPLDISPFTSYQDVSIAQAGSGVVVAALYGTKGTFLDLYYAGPGPTKRTLGGGSWSAYYAVSSPVSMSNPRVVRGNGGRAVVLWRETDGSGATRIKMARVSFSGAGTAWNVSTVTAPKDLISVSGNTGAFAVAASFEDGVDAQSCGTGLARFAVAYRVGDQLRLDTFNEEGTLAGATSTVYAGTSALSPRNPTVAYANVGGDRWSVGFSVSRASPAGEALYLWNSGGSASAVGTFHAGNGSNSISDVRLAARPGELLLSALVDDTAGSAIEPQVWLGAISNAGATVLPFGPVSVYSGCVGLNCSEGIKKVPRPLSSGAGTFKTRGAVVYGNALRTLTASVVGCN